MWKLTIFVLMLVGSPQGPQVAGSHSIDVGTFKSLDSCTQASKMTTSAMEQALQGMPIKPVCLPADDTAVSDSVMQYFNAMQRKKEEAEALQQQRDNAQKEYEKKQKEHNSL